MSLKKSFFIHLMLLVGYITYLGTHEFIHYQEVSSSTYHQLDRSNGQYSESFDHDTFHLAGSVQRCFCADYSFAPTFIDTPNLLIKTVQFDLSTISIPKVSFPYISTYYYGQTVRLVI